MTNRTIDEIEVEIEITRKKIKPARDALDRIIAKRDFLMIELRSAVMALKDKL